MIKTNKKTKQKSIKHTSNNDWIHYSHIYRKPLSLPQILSTVCCACSTNIHPFTPILTTCTIILWSIITQIHQISIIKQNSNKTSIVARLVTYLVDHMLLDSQILVLCVCGSSGNVLGLPRFFDVNKYLYYNAHASWLDKQQLLDCISMKYNEYLTLQQ